MTTMESWVSRLDVPRAITGFNRVGLGLKLSFLTQNVLERKR